MYNIDIQNNNNKKTFIFHGAINSANAEEIGKIINENIVGLEAAVFDFQDVNYISSAGLRLVLKTGKAIKDFELINAIPEVYEIFDMTGFTQIIKVSRALREISIEGKELIGEGYMGRVYRLDPETIIKVYYRNSTIDDIKKEISLAKTAFVLGIPTAIPFDVVKVKEGFYGSVFELLNSNCFNKLFINNPENTDQYVKMYIDLLKEIMSIKIEGNVALPNKKDNAREWCRYLTEHKAFEPRILEKMHILIEEIPEEKHLIHGDYHIKNIMMQGDEPLLIDMDTLGIGHEIFEFSAFYLTYIGYPSTDPGNIKTFLGIEQDVADKLFYGSVNEAYKDKTEDERKQIIDKVALLGYFWLTYKTLFFEPDNNVRLEHSKSEVMRLIDEVDTLAF